MTRAATALLCICLPMAAGCSRSEPAGVQARSTYTDPVQGFSLTAPQFPGSDGTKACVAISLTAPYAKGFASNVNVTIQPVRTSLAKFTELTVAQLEESGLKINATRNLKVSGHDAVEMDYEGTLQTLGNTRKLRFLVVSVIDTDRVVAMSCMAQPEEFAAAEPEFRSCLASFAVR